MSPVNEPVEEGLVRVGERLMDLEEWRAMAAQALEGAGPEA